MTEKSQLVFCHLSLSSSCKSLSIFPRKLINRFSGCCTLILTPFIIRHFENLCYESTFHTGSTKTISFAYGHAGTQVTYQEANTYCSECQNMPEHTGGCKAGVTGRLVDMDDENDVNAVNEVLHVELRTSVTFISAYCRNHATTLRRNLLGCP